MPLADDEVLAYRALRELDLVLDAYRAAARAHAAILARAFGDGAPETADPAVLLKVEQRRALARETDLVCAIRSDQVRRRMFRLRSRVP